MKTKLIIATLGLASVLSFGASAAVQQVNADQHKICSLWAASP